MSEEALEANHKNVRKARLSHTRKTSRENTNKDLMTHLLLSSDPMLSSSRKIIQVKNKAFVEEIDKYILKENHNICVEEDEEEEEKTSSWIEDSSSDEYFL